MNNIEEKLNQLPPDLQLEVVNFIDFLLFKSAQRKKNKINIEWMIGGLKEYRDQYSSVELQKKSNEWRI
jgi:hypothetical protein